MKCLFPYSALAAGGLGLLCFVLTFFYFPLCYVAIGLFILSEVLFIICIVKGVCCSFKEKNPAQ